MNVDDSLSSNSEKTTEESSEKSEDNSDKDPTYNNKDDEHDEHDESEEYYNYEDDEDDYENEIIQNTNIPNGGFFNKHDEEENYNTKQKFFLILNPPRKTANKKIQKKKYDFYHKYTMIEKKYFDNLSDEDKDKIKIKEDSINDELISDMPMRFRILNLNINERTKKNIIAKIDSFNNMSPCSSEYNKLKNWLQALNNIPFNDYYEIPIKISDGNDKICDFLNGIRKKMEDTVYGHKDAKEQIIRVLAQLVSFPKANGYIIGIQGSAGVGKTKLIKEGICNALNYPNAFISLGGTDDSSFLRGHSYTYEGATYGKICESLMKTGIMNPLFLFDELDKVSNTYRGQEIINTLIHITDPVQNDKYNDRYFEEIDFDISRSMIIFTYNDEELINPILKDRMIVINVPGYSNEEKLVLAKDYIVPEILKQYNLEISDIIFNSELLKHIIGDVQKEDGVRNLKRAINNIISWVNMMRYVPTDSVKINLPYVVTIDFYDKYCKYNNNSEYDKNMHHLYL